MTARVRSPARHNAAEQAPNCEAIVENELAAPHSGAVLDMEFRQRHQFKNKEMYCSAKPNFEPLKTGARP
jgi:hypothetical protein